MKKIVCLLIAVMLALVCFASTLAFAETATSDTVYLSSSGSDYNSGSQARPFATLNKAIDSVADGGTVVVMGTYRLPSGFTWQPHSKAVTLTGGVINATALSGSLTLGDDVVFKSMTLTFNGGATIYANGHVMTISEDVTVNGRINVFGGGVSGTVVDSTDITILSGEYTNIWGGSDGGTVRGDTHVYVGGKVNPSLNVSDHGGGRHIYGGGDNDTIGGTTHLTFTGNARSTHLFGGSRGANSSIGGGTDVLLAGGQSMSVYAGSDAGDTTSGASLVMTGGAVEQVFGGCQNYGLTGNVSVSVLGGTVTRRIYGGSYNDMDPKANLFKPWLSSYFVDGSITLTLGAGATIEFDTSFNDIGVYACTRYGQNIDTGDITVFFENSAAYDAHKSKLGPQDSVMSLYMSGMKNPEYTHVGVYSADGSVITQKCSLCTSHSATATLSLDTDVSLIYSGKAIKAAKLTYSDNWIGYMPDIVYSDNINVGTATASVSFADVRVSLNFDIQKASPSAPVLQAVAESIKGRADGRISGLTTDMEYSTDGETFTAVNNTEASLAAGRYYVRYADTANVNRSEVTEITVGEGRMLKVTFMANGKQVASVEVEWQGSVTDIPAIPTRDGFTQTAPYWSITELENITEDMTVTAVYTKDAEKEEATSDTSAASEPSDDGKQVQAETKKDGCKGSLSASALLPLMCVAALAVRKRKKY